MLARADQVEESLRSDPDATQTAPFVRQEHTPLKQVMSPLCCRIESSLQYAGLNHHFNMQSIGCVRLCLSLCRHY